MSGKYEMNFDFSEIEKEINSRKVLGIKRFRFFEKGRFSFYQDLGEIDFRFLISFTENDGIGTFLAISVLFWKIEILLIKDK